MNEIVQILLFVVITTLTILLTLVAFQIIYILKEFRKTIEKINKILDDFGGISSSFANSVSELTGLASGLRAFFSIFNFLKKKKEKNE